MSTYEGIWVPLVTPFKQGKIDFDTAQQLAIRLMASGVHGLVVCGTTGEAATLNENEQSLLLAAILEVTAGSCPVLMGISGSDTQVLTEKVMRFSHQAQTGFLVSAPSYVRPSQEGIRQHFEALARATEKAIVLYNIPARTGVNIDLGTVIALQQQRNIVAIKECGGTLTQIRGLINCTHLQVMCGDDAMLFDALCVGGHAAISAAAHVRPDLFVHLYELMHTGHTREAGALFNQLLPLIQLLFSESNPAPLKAALAMQGQLREELRLPMTPMSAEGKTRLAREQEKVMAIPVPHKLPGTLSLVKNKLGSYALEK
ncbi:4-hydroxy-tetrahydrodipicolinate synthase [Undibacterium sp. TJN19]|uniref:4-hydroxy-tetrahydrodipicolinate synthase n=1 Tax=Undibacterium sp. TJN19 TaxID=3413055 RepID=UPI003BF3CA0B